METEFFSRLKLIKDILRSTTSDDRLSALVVISIADKISALYDSLMNQLLENKARKKGFAL